jgi:uncharacterized protein (DUF3084 family)
MRVVCQELVTQNLLNQRLSLQRNIEFVKRKLEQALVRRAGEEEEERKVNAQAAAVQSRTRELQQVNADKMREVEKLRTANSSVLSQVHTHTHTHTRTHTHTHTTWRRCEKVYTEAHKK